MEATIFFSKENYGSYFEDVYFNLNWEKISIDEENKLTYYKKQRDDFLDDYPDLKVRREFIDNVGPLKRNASDIFQTEFFGLKTHEKFNSSLKSWSNAHYYLITPEDIWVLANIFLTNNTHLITNLRLFESYNLMLLKEKRGANYASTTHNFDCYWMLTEAFLKSKKYKNTTMYVGFCNW